MDSLDVNKYNGIVDMLWERQDYSGSRKTIKIKNLPFKENGIIEIDCLTQNIMRDGLHPTAFNFSALKP